MDELKNKALDKSQLDQGGEDTGGETTVLSADKYPALKGLEPGAMVKGTWEGKVESNDNGQVTISYTALEIEGGENKADKELTRITGKKAVKPVTNEPAGESDEENDF